MAIEIEHKFLLANEEWRKEVSHSVYYKQGYLSNNPSTSVRIRISNSEAWVNIKSATIGNHRHEFEYPIPLKDAQLMLDELCIKPLIEKTRHYVPKNRHLWEIDEFLGENLGLIVAEIELSSLNEDFSRPNWIGEEVTHDVRYYNNNLCQNPYKKWKD